MTRVKRGVPAHRKHKKILKLAKGFKGKRNNLFKSAKEGVLKAGSHAYRGRKEKKRTFRRLWITRINAALRLKGFRYSAFIAKQNEKNIELDRKLLSDLAATEAKIFDKIVDTVMA